jgi:hypothetical protein
VTTPSAATRTSRELAPWVRRALNRTAAISLPGIGQPQFISQWVPAGTVVAGTWIWKVGPSDTAVVNGEPTAQMDEPKG